MPVKSKAQAKTKIQHNERNVSPSNSLTTHGEFQISQHQVNYRQLIVNGMIHLS